MAIIDYLQQMWSLARDGQAQGVFFFIALYALVMLLYSLRYQIKVSSYPSVMGELVDERIREFGYAQAPSQKDYVAAVSYRYGVDGREYTGSRLSPWVFVTNNNARFILNKQLRAIGRDTNGKVAVFYDPKKPHKSFLVKPGLFGKLVTAVLALLPWGLYWVKYFP